MKQLKYGFDHTTGDGQKKLMALSVGLDPEHWIGKPIDIQKAGDYGCDPLGDALFRMVPSGDVVCLDEMTRKLRRES
ncbi:MAG: hypothetical protein WCO89_00115 [Syntrophus sp. (in: bacteria)]